MWSYPSQHWFLSHEIIALSLLGWFPAWSFDSVVQPCQCTGTISDKTLTYFFGCCLENSLCEIYKFISNWTYKLLYKISPQHKFCLHRFLFINNVFIISLLKWQVSWSRNIKAISELYLVKQFFVKLLSMADVHHLILQPSSSLACDIEKTGLLCKLRFFLVSNEWIKIIIWTWCYPILTLLSIFQTITVLKSLL